MSHPSQKIPYTVLIVEDELAIAENLLLALEAEGWIVDISRDAHSALHRLGRDSYDLVLLDIGLPGMDGYRMLQQMREDMRLATPVLLLTARAALEDKRQGFADGADDYLTKPFALEEVVMRARALVRRSKQLSDTALVLEYGSIRYFVADQRVWVGGIEVKLSRKSLRILELLVRYGGRVVSRQRLEEYLWQGEPPSAEALRSQMHLLRKTLHAAGHDGIETVHGIGWRLAGRQPE
ncbi:MAG: response regulator transcription factor [Pigmentiphaga sp.]|nr:response regulator transcription factor [Pigmentiphaga sp.]